jgi:hypothetical protein
MFSSGDVATDGGQFAEATRTAGKLRGAIQIFGKTKAGLEKGETTGFKMMDFLHLVGVQNSICLQQGHRS